MANYYATARSNYFKVKDLEKFKKEMQDYAVEVVERDGLVALMSDDPDGAGWNFCVYDEESDDYIDNSAEEIIAPHLADGWVCVLQETGSEKLRYLIGYALAFNNKGEAVSVNLDDIYQMVQDKGMGEVTTASY